MNMTIDRRHFMLGTAATTLLPTSVFADAHGDNIVEMLSKHPDNKKLRNVFLPRIKVIEAGESILFKATNRGHNSASMKGMIPPDATPWRGELSQDVEVAFDIPGFYGYICVPHSPLGMVGLVVVKGDGMFDNLEAAKSVKQRGKAKKVFEEIWTEAEELGLLT